MGKYSLELVVWGYKMVRLLKQLCKTVLPVILLVPVLVSAGPVELNEAVKQYYAGYPEQALGLLEPMAMDGDVEAQYLMGNILYSLSKTEKYKNSGDPVKWYQMAAEQGVADASYALGVIYQNAWNESRDQMQAALAMTYLQKASDAGFSKAATPLNRLKAKTGMSVKAASKLAKKAGKLVVAKVEPAKKIAETTKTQQVVKQPEKKVAVIAKTEPDENLNKVETPVAVPEKEEPGRIEPVAVAKQPPQAEPIANLDDTSSDDEITLSELAGECGNYTQIGYNYYAESIKGAQFTGNATVTKTVASGSSTKKVSLVNDKFGIDVVLRLNNVPNKTAANLRVGQHMDINATIDHSQIIGASCVVNLTYQLAKS